MMDPGGDGKDGSQSIENNKADYITYCVKCTLRTPGG